MSKLVGVHEEKTKNYQIVLDKLPNDILVNIFNTIVGFTQSPSNHLEAFFSDYDSPDLCILPTMLASFLDTKILKSPFGNSKNNSHDATNILRQYEENKKKFPSYLHKESTLSYNYHKYDNGVHTREFSATALILSDQYNYRELFSIYYKNSSFAYEHKTSIPIITLKHANVVPHNLIHSTSMHLFGFIKIMFSSVCNFCSVNKNMRSFFLQYRTFWMTLAKKISCFGDMYRGDQNLSANGIQKCLENTTTVSLREYVMKFVFMPYKFTANQVPWDKQHIIEPLFDTTTVRRMLNGIKSMVMFDGDKRTTVMYNIMICKPYLCIIELYNKLIDGALPEEHNNLIEYIETHHIVPTFDALENTITYFQTLIETLTPQEIYKKSFLHVHETENNGKSNCNVKNMRGLCYKLYPNVKKFMSLTMSSEIESLMRLLEELYIGYDLMKTLFGSINRPNFQIKKSMFGLIQNTDQKTSEISKEIDNKKKSTKVSKKRKNDENDSKPNKRPKTH
jgi:hypothetical protein